MKCKVFYMLKEEKNFIIMNYILTLIGMILSIIYPNHSLLGIVISMIILPHSLLFLQVIYNKFISKYKEYYKNFLNTYIVVGLISSILIPFLIGYVSSNAILLNDANSFSIHLTLIFLISLVFSSEVRKRLYDDGKLPFEKSFLVLEILVMILTFIPDGSILLNKFFNIIFYDVSDFLSVSIALIMLSATFSALSFTYKSQIGNNMKTMRKNGENYFISTILSIIPISCLFLSYIINPHLSKLVISFETPNIINFVFLNFYSILLILAVIFTCYSLYYFIKSSISSLKVLKFIEEH